MSGVGWVFSTECKGLGRVYFQSEKKEGHDGRNLNVEVVGSDGGEHGGGPFVMQLKQKWVASFMKKHGAGHGEKDVEWWIKVVRFVFLGEVGDDDNGFDDVVVDAEYSEEDEDMSMAIKQRFRTERTEVFTILGELRISRKRSHKTSLEDILANSCTLLSRTNRQFRDADRKYRSLDRQMSEFVDKKKESDDMMMHRFLVLLNAKKQKINELAAMASMRQELKNNNDDDDQNQLSDNADNNEERAESDGPGSEDEAMPTANEQANTNPAADDSQAETTDDED